MDEMIYDIAFSFDETITPMEKSLLFEKFKSSEKILSLNKGTLKNILGRKWTGKSFAPDDFIKKALSVSNYISKAGIKVIRFDSDEYPEALKNIPDLPFLIYVRGDIKYDFEKSAAIVGTRKPSFTGLKNTDDFASYLAKKDFTIISGLALGVDAKAHESALLNKSKTIAVLGCGIDMIYPAVNKELAKNILACGGAIISEYPPGILPDQWRFPRRNRIIVGLSKFVLITQAPERSGSIISAYLAADYNRELFVVSPSGENSIVEAGNKMLIFKGAEEVKTPEEMSL
jgi:DNA processing protein